MSDTYSKEQRTQDYYYCKLKINNKNYKQLLVLVQSRSEMVGRNVELRERAKTVCEIIGEEKMPLH